MGLPITEAPPRTWLARLGYPDPAATIAVLDDGLGEVRLQPTAARVSSLSGLRTRVTHRYQYLGHRLV